SSPLTPQQAPSATSGHVFGSHLHLPATQRRPLSQLGPLPQPQLPPLQLSDVSSHALPLHVKPHSESGPAATHVAAVAFAGTGHLAQALPQVTGFVVSAHTEPQVFWPAGQPQAPAAQTLPLSMAPQAVPSGWFPSACMHVGAPFTHAVIPFWQSLG